VKHVRAFHKHWVKGSDYDDPGGRLGIPQWEEFVDAIREKKRVILTNSERQEDGGFVRKGYIAVFGVNQVELDENGLRFKLISRQAELE